MARFSRLSVILLARTGHIFFENSNPVNLFTWTILWMTFQCVNIELSTVHYIKI